MNEQQPYEKYLAEKLQQLPLPDVEPNWQQMKSLLDREMPRGGGYWRWITGIGILLIMLGGTWYFTSLKDTIGITNEIVKEKTDSTNQTIAGNTSENSLKKPIQKDNEASSSIKNPTAPTRNQQSQESFKTKNVEENLHTNLRSEVPQATNPVSKQSNKTVPDKNSGYPKKNNENFLKENISKNELPGDESDLQSKKLNPGEIEAKKPAQFRNQVFEYDRNNLTAESPLKNSPVQYKAQNIILDFTLNKLIGDSIKKNYYTNMFPESGLENPKQSGKISRKTKSSKSGNLDAGENKNLAVGFSLPMGFPLGDQKPGAYNINAKPNTISDFLPVPHLQYHINNKVYLQTELQLMNPQFIQPVLLYQHKTEYPSTNSVHYNSIYAKKLYYFNIPVGIHYSPFRYFYLGTGLQFSSLVSGVAMQEETSFVIGSGRNTLLSQRYTKFKNDSISNRIDNSEFRLMLDANYYWKQFTVGLRYNQALSNYVSFRLNNVTPLFQDKNKSLQFYLRYNLWEDHKRKKK